jgi:hypothetical protein
MRLKADAARLPQLRTVWLHPPSSKKKCGCTVWRLNPKHRDLAPLRLFLMFGVAEGYVCWLLLLHGSGRFTLLLVFVVCTVFFPVLCLGVCNLDNPIGSQARLTGSLHHRACLEYSSIVTYFSVLFLRSGVYRGLTLLAPAPC